MFLNFHTVVTIIELLDFTFSIGLYKLQNKRWITWKVSRQLCECHLCTHIEESIKWRVKLQVVSEGAGTAQAVEEILCCCLGAQSCPPLWDPMDCSLPGSSVHGISQARILEWVAIAFSRGSFQPGEWTCVSCIGRKILYFWAIREAHKLN